MNVVAVHLRNLLDEMVSEEERLKQKILRKLTANKEQIATICKELQISLYEVSVL